MSCTLQDLAELCGAEIKGDQATRIDSVNTLKSAKAGQLSFLSNRRYVDFLKNTQASAVVLAKSDVEKCPTNALISDNPYLAYAKIVNFLYPQKKQNAGIAEGIIIPDSCCLDKTVTISGHVSIGENVEIGSNSFIGPGSVIGDNVRVGQDCSLIANVTLCHDITIGNSVSLHPGVVIGSDGFGLAQDQNRWLKIAQIGSVIIHDNVEIGANATVDRGAIEDTVIERGVKIDNQVQIGHNVIIGEDTAIAGRVGVAGSAIIGKRCQIGGASAINGHITIADDVIITGMSGVPNSISTAGVYSSGLPVTDNKTWRKNIIRFRQLDEIIKKIMSRLD